MTYEQANDIVAAWAMTANDHNYASLDMQLAVANEFNIPLSTWQKDSIEDVIKAKKAFDDYTASEQFATDTEHKLQEMHKRRLDAMKNDPTRTDWDQYDWADNRDFAAAGARNDFLQANTKNIWKYLYNTDQLYSSTTTEEKMRAARVMYNWTQYELGKREIGPDDEVMLFRGVGDTDLGAFNDVKPYSGNAIESWSISYKSAYSFRTGQGDVLAISIPRKYIFSSARTGLGCLDEYEYVIFGSVGHKVRMAKYSYGEAES